MIKNVSSREHKKLNKLKRPRARSASSAYLKFPDRQVTLTPTGSLIVKINDKSSEIIKDEKSVEDLENSLSKESGIVLKTIEIKSPKCDVKMLKKTDNTDIKII